MKTLLGLFVFLGSLSLSWAASTINSANKYAYGANIGWIDWRGNTNNGAVIGEYVCSGYIYSANCGWIHLGSNAPVNGIRYQNNSATDYGVNHDGFGNLSGFAYGANIGWIVFTNSTGAGPLASTNLPRVDLKTGKLSGYAYSANCGWISLSNAFAYVQTDTIAPGADTDIDGIADGWERSYAGNLTTFTSSSDSDSDGVSDMKEYLADTNPLDPNDFLKITTFVAGGANNNFTWTSKLSRLYKLQQKDDLNPATAWGDSGLGLVSPDGATTARIIANTVTTNRFWRVQALKPLSP